ncbi:MAG: HD domain-containing protein, partial [Oscillospiraceae bacterium]|nr:HD domain-containing protein [Oscillospiraceae bacterium]
MVRKGLIELIFDMAYMMRWNDYLRPVELFEVDKQAHKMMAAFFIGRFEEEGGGGGLDWVKVIEYGLFDMLQRLILTDIKPSIIAKVKADPEKYRKLNEYAYERLRVYIRPLGEGFCGRYKAYVEGGCEGDVNRKVVEAAHLYASQWEFGIISRLNRDADAMAIEEEYRVRMGSYRHLRGVDAIASDGRYVRFLDLCGRMRYQVRWAQLHKVPRTSVLGHSLFVAVYAYLFSMDSGLSRERLINNYMTGLFHDLAEIVTRDIISPVKHSSTEFDGLIKEYEREEMEKTVYPL